VHATACSVKLHGNLLENEKKLRTNLFAAAQVAVIVKVRVIAG
jgi:hypothetical protein